MGNDQAGATRSVSGQDSHRDPGESIDPLLDHLARASVLLALEAELKAFVRMRNSDSDRGRPRMSLAVASAIAYATDCLGSLKRDLCHLYQRLPGTMRRA